MRVISNKALKDFSAKNPKADVPLQEWRKIIESSNLLSFADLKKSFNTVDYVANKYYVFNIGGNKYRIISTVHFDKQRLYVRYVFTHKEYDVWCKIP